MLMQRLMQLTVLGGLGTIICCRSMSTSWNAFFMILPSGNVSRRRGLFYDNVMMEAGNTTHIPDSMPGPSMSHT